MLSVLSATEACYGIKEINNNKEKSFCRGKLPFCRLKLPFYWRKLRKTYFRWHFFTGTNYHFADANSEKPTLHRHFLATTQKSELQGLNT